jgi:phosphate transport system substrate-binding protein
VKADLGGATFVRAARATMPGIKVLPVSRGDGPAINPLDIDATDRDYPLVRPLSLVVAVGTKEKPNLLPIEFVTYALSRLGQIELLKDGFVPLSRQQTNAQMELLGQERAR